MTSEYRAMTRSRESAASTYNGYLMLLVLLAVLVVGWIMVSGGLPPQAASKAMKLAFVGTIVVAVGLAGLVLAGFFMIQPNQAAVITLFGEYRGTDRTQGLRWIWPWMGQQEDLGPRAQHPFGAGQDQRPARQPDRDRLQRRVARRRHRAGGVRRRRLSSEFVNIQIEAGLRTVGARHPYDDMSEDDKTTLRGSADVVNSRTARPNSTSGSHVAGIVVDEAGLTHLAYAPEIAGAMLRRQQAEAVIAARAKLVMGAVGMVRDGARQAERGRDRPSRRRAPRGDGLEPDGRAVRRARREPVVNAGTLYT